MSQTQHLEQDHQSNKLAKKSFIISLLAVFVQYYDYHLFAFLAVDIGSYFFPTSQNALIYTYAIMTIAFVAKPIGAIILGAIGDKYGRSTSFNLSLYGTFIGSVSLALCPPSSNLGIISFMILISARMLICACVSAGSDGVRIYIFEKIAPNKKTLGVALTTLFTQSGSLFAAFSAYLFTKEYFPDYFWKFSFLIGAVLALLLIVIIKYYNITNNEFEERKRQNNTQIFQSQKLFQLISGNWKLTLLCLIQAGCIGSANQFQIMFFGTYTFAVLSVIDESTMKLLVPCAILFFTLGSFTASYIADKYSQFNTIIIASILLTTVIILQANYLVNNQLNIYCYFVSSFLLPHILMPAAVIYKQSIKKSIRYRLFSLTHSIGSILISAPTSLISTILYRQTGLSYLPLALFIIIIFLLSITSYNLKKFAS